MTIRFFLFVILTIQVTVPSTAGGFQASSSRQDDLADKTEVIQGIIKVHSPPYSGQLFSCQLKGKPIPQGDSRKFHLILKNNSELELRFNEIKVFCNCVTVDCPERSVGPGDSLKLTASYRTPVKTRGLNYGFSLNFFASGKPIGIVTVTGDLHNTLAIISNGLYQANGTVSLWEVPLMTSSPINVDRLRVELGESLRELAAEIVQKEGKTLIQITGPEASLGLAGISGEIKVIDPDLNLFDSVVATFAKVPLIRISPLFARFVEIEDQPGWYTASFLVQAHSFKRSSDTDNDKTRYSLGDNRLTSIQCQLKEHTFEIEKKKIKDTLFKVEVKIKRSEDPQLDSGFDLNWEIESLHGKRSMACSCYFLERQK